MRAWLNLRGSVPEREQAFRAGLEAIGYRVELGLTWEPRADDVMVCWNRIGDTHRAAEGFEARGLKVLIAENAAFGNDLRGGRWYSLARNYHNTAGRFPVGDGGRWDALGIELAPWRTEGETVILPQRGIGPPGVAMPRGWELGKAGRIRPHPGRFDAISIEKDLAAAGKVITWGSGAAIKALMLGIPVESHMPNWIGEQDNTDAGRLEMFRRLAWAQWRLEEFATGAPFKAMLQ